MDNDSMGTTVNACWLFHRPSLSLSTLLGFSALLCCLFAPPSALAADADAECLDCHEGEFTEPFNVGWHVHANARGGGEAGSCTACHGPSVAHLEKPRKNDTDIMFLDSPELAEQQNSSCLNCHEDAKRGWWAGSAHQQEDLSCTSCHQVHTSVDKTAAREEQSSTCYSCHTEVRSAASLRSRHPIHEGQTSCSDCHQTHGSANESLLSAPTLNDSCYGCHAEKRGPYLFEHAPVSEDCSTCHLPHGSVNDALLVARTPFLCQQCHSAAFHPSQLNSGSGLPANGASPSLLGKNCMNCHNAVHGSNHPSGARMTR